MVAAHFELDLGMGQKAQLVSDLLRNGDLTLARDLHQ
jgi:hypothetical protein